MKMSIRDLMERRVPQYLAVYLGVGWGLVEFLSFLEERYAISSAWTDVLLIVWAILIPSVLLFAWNHGRPGADQVTRTERVAIPLNIMLAVVLGFGGRDLRAATTRIEVVNENGETIERTVARSEHRKRVALFAFDAASVDPENLWLRDAATVALYTDLSQDIFIDTRYPLHLATTMKNVGADSVYGLHISTKRGVADQAHLPYFISGTVETSNSGVTLRATVYETATGVAVGERAVTAANVLDATDRLSVLIRQDLGLPQTRAEDVQDLPVASFLSHDPAALRAYSEGVFATLRQDWDRVRERFTRAVELDPTFASAQLGLYQAQVFLGNPAAGMPALAAAMRNLSRMPERFGQFVKVEHFMMNQQMDRAIDVLEMTLSIYPDDLDARSVLAQLLVYQDDKPAALEQVKQILELDPQRQEMRIQLGALQEAMGLNREAIGTYSAYVETYPDELAGYLPLARLQMRTGQHAAARATLERAQIVDPSSVAPTIELATLDRITGDFESAERHIDAAGRAARSAEDSISWLDAQRSMYEFRGRPNDAIAVFERSMPLRRRTQAPVHALSEEMNAIAMYGTANRMAEAEAILARTRATFTPPMDGFWRLGQARLAIETRDTVALREGRDGVQAILDGFGFNHVRPLILLADGILAEERGDWAAALASYQQTVALFPIAIQQHRDVSRVFREMGRLDDAARAIEQHLLTSPASPESNLEAARVQLARGDRAAAQRHLDRVAAGWADAEPNFAGLRELRALQAQLQ